MAKTSKGRGTISKKPGKTRVKAETPPAAALGASPTSRFFVEQTYESPYTPSEPSGLSSSSSVASAPCLEPPISKKFCASPSKGKKRPRRSTASMVKNYLVPDSDDESILGEQKSDSMSLTKSEVGKKKAESNLQRWIKHLTALQKEELKKVNNH